MTLPTLANGCAAEVNVLLGERYLEVLGRHELATIAQSEKSGVFSGVFLPAVDDAYLQSAVRVMLIGQEPKKWGKGIHTLAAKEGSASALSLYVQTQMDAYSKFASTPPRKSRFRQFHSHLHAALGSQARGGQNEIFWGNLLCMSRNLGSPTSAAEIGRIAALSRDLLTVQFDILQPQLVVFATGYGYDGFLKEQIGHQYTTLPGLKAKHYWPFAVHKPQFMAWRVRHPRRLTRDIRDELLAAVAKAAHSCRNGPGKDASSDSA